MSVKGIMKQTVGYQATEKPAVTNNDSTIAATNATTQVQQPVKVDLENGSNEGQAKDKNSEYNAVKNAINDINTKLKPTRTGCEFTYNEKVNRVSIKVINKETNEVIKEIPPEDAYKALEKVWEIAGLIVDEKL